MSRKIPNPGSDPLFNQHRYNIDKLSEILKQKYQAYTGEERSGYVKKENYIANLLVNLTGTIPKLREFDPKERERLYFDVWKKTTGKYNEAEYKMHMQYEKRNGYNYWN